VNASIRYPWLRDQGIHIVSGAGAAGAGVARATWHHVVFVVPIISRDRGLRHQIPIASPASGLSKLPSFTRPEDARPVAYQRLNHRLGAVTADELAAVRRILRAFLDL
jgi:mRNA-degrading endonuclease toxin of MazEF toxin-antitoxin module